MYKRLKRVGMVLVEVNQAIISLEFGSSQGYKKYFFFWYQKFPPKFALWNAELLFSKNVTKKLIENGVVSIHKTIKTQARTIHEYDN